MTTLSDRSIAEIWAGQLSMVRQGPEPTEHRVIFPGAFNPLHAGHCRMAELGQARLQSPVVFELSVTNVDKRPLDPLDIRRRCEQFAPHQALVITRAPRFVDKVALFPDSTFIVGADTMRRIADPAYYSHDSQQRDEAIGQLVRHNVRFLVFGRTCVASFVELDDLALPDLLRERCDSVGKGLFHMDISSSELRK